MSNLDQDYKALETSTHARLLFINKTIRDLRKNSCYLNKEELTYYKQKRKETDQLLSKIRNLYKDDRETYLKLRDQYLTFQL